MIFLLMNARNSPVWELLLENGGIIRKSKLIKLTVLYFITAMSGGGGGGGKRCSHDMSVRYRHDMTGQTGS
jgi:hypothetical protein